MTGSTCIVCNNTVHGLFVRRTGVQDGPNAQTYNVWLQICARCMQALRSDVHRSAPNRKPPQAGFFFHSIDVVHPPGAGFPLTFGAAKNRGKAFF
eukprot:364741-Chlamydomonas_euryale.AAC.5